MVDKAAKIPAWLGRAAKSYYSKYYLDLAIESKNTKNVSSALKMLQGGRVWKNRPRAGKVKNEKIISLKPNLNKLKSNQVENKISDPWTSIGTILGQTV